MARPLNPDEFAGVTFDHGEFFILFDHDTGRGGRARKRIQLRDEDIDVLRRVLDAYELMTRPAPARGGMNP